MSFRIESVLGVLSLEAESNWKSHVWEVWEVPPFRQTRHRVEVANKHVSCLVFFGEVPPLREKP